MDQEAKYAEAKKRVLALKAFYINLLSYTLIMPVLVAWNVYDPKYWWVQWPALGWGIGVVCQAWSVFVPKTIPLGPQWEEKKIREFLAQM